MDWKSPESKVHLFLRWTFDLTRLQLQCNGRHIVDCVVFYYTGWDKVRGKYQHHEIYMAGRIPPGEKVKVHEKS
jgi:hypothetical protein